MPYSAEISRTNPSCFVFLIDQSFSMEDSWGAGESTRQTAEGVADAINTDLAEFTAIEQRALPPRRIRQGCDAQLAAPTPELDSASHGRTALH